MGMGHKLQAGAPMSKTLTDPYKDLFYAMQEADRHLRANNGRAVKPEFAEIWQEVVEKYAQAEAHFVATELEEVIL